MKKLFGLCFVLVLLCCGVIFGSYTNGIWHLAEDVRAGTFGANEGGGDFVFTGNVGIGTSSGPGGNLEITSNGIPTIILSTDVNFAGSTKGLTKHSIFGPYDAITGSQGALYIGAGRSNDLSKNDIILYNTGCSAGSSGSNDCNAKSIQLRGDDIFLSGNVGIGTNSPSQKLDVVGNIKFSGAIVAPEGTLRDDNGGWVRTYGNTGWYSQTYGGGWYMSDSTWIRSYGGKSVYTGAGIIRSDASVRAPIFYDQDNTGYYVNPASTSNLNRVKTAYTPTQNNDVANKAYVDSKSIIKNGDTYYVFVNGPSGDYYCADGYYTYGVNYDSNNDDHINGFYCKKLY